MGCPIRKSTDQRLLAASRGLSQLAASFIACWHQGIHRIALSSLITKVKLTFHAPGLAAQNIVIKKTQRIVYNYALFFLLPMCRCQRTRAHPYSLPRSLALTKLSRQHVNSKDSRIYKPNIYKPETKRLFHSPRLFLFRNIPSPPPRRSGGPDWT